MSENEMPSSASSETRFIWCDSCEAIKPMVVVLLGGKDVTGKFTEPADLLCGDCNSVIATTYAAGTAPSATNALGPTARPAEQGQPAIGAPSAAAAPSSVPSADTAIPYKDGILSKLRAFATAFKAAYPDIRQLQDGFAQDEGWSVWDEAVRQKTIDLGSMVFDDMLSRGENASTCPQCQVTWTAPVTVCPECGNAAPLDAFVASQREPDDDLRRAAVAAKQAGEPVAAPSEAPMKCSGVDCERCEAFERRAIAAEEELQRVKAERGELAAGTENLQAQAAGISFILREQRRAAAKSVRSAEARTDPGEQQKEAWLAVCNLLNEVAPDWHNEPGCGVEKALATIRRLAPSSERDTGILNSLDWERLLAGDHRALNPDNQPLFDAYYASSANAEMARDAKRYRLARTHEFRLIDLRDEEALDATMRAAPT